MKKYLSVLKKCMLFQGLSDEEILTFLHCTKADVQSVSKDEFLLRAGDATDSIGLLLAGTALVIQEDLWGNRNVITKLSPGDFFAEPFAILPDVVSSVSVIAAEECEVMELEIRRLLTVCPAACDHHNRLIRNLVSAFAKKLLLFNDKITHMSKRKTRDKLLSYLSAESLRQGSLSFDIPFDRQQLADYLCVERAAMSVELSKLQQEGILKTTRSHFELNIDSMETCTARQV